MQIVAEEGEPDLIPQSAQVAVPINRNAEKIGKDRMKGFK